MRELGDAEEFHDRTSRASGRWECRDAIRRGVVRTPRADGERAESVS